MQRVTSFDFRSGRRLDKFANNQLQTLRTLHENFTRLLNNSLSIYLRTRVEATVLSVDQETYGDFLSTVGQSSILSIFSMDPLAGSGMVQVDLGLVFSIIDRLLGGPGWAPAKMRDLSDIERTLMQRFMARMLNSYRESWSYLLTLSLRIEALDSNPQFIPRIIPLDQIVALVRFELKVGDATGVMTMCLPHAVLQGIGAQLSDFQWSPSVAATEGTSDEARALLERSVERANVDLTVELGRTTVSLRDLFALSPGDLVVFDALVDEPLRARINERQKFTVYPGVNRDTLAVRVAEILPCEE